MQARNLKYLVLCLPVLYLGYGITLALQFGSRPELINSAANGLFLLIITFILTKKAVLKTSIDFVWFIVFILYVFVLHHLVTYIALGDFVSSTYTGNFYIQTDMINLKPFTTIENTVKQTLPTMPTIIQIVGNALLLAPLSFFLLYFKICKRASMAILVVFLTSCMIELVQFAQTTLITGFDGIMLPTGRSTDIDDVILNTLSGCLGVIVMYSVPTLRKRIGKRKR